MAYGDRNPYGVGQINRESVGTALQRSGGQGEGAITAPEGGPGEAVSGVGTNEEENSWLQLLGDRNVQQFLAQLGGNVGKANFEEGDTVGQVLAGPASNLIQREALSEALAKNSNVTVGADGSVKVQQPTSGQGQSQGQGQGEGAITTPSGGPGEAVGGEDQNKGYNVPRSKDTDDYFDRLAMDFFGADKEE